MSKNLIIIIGNGFDLAHGLKTGYNHFADYFIETRIIPELKEILQSKKNKNNFFDANFFKNILDKNRASTYKDYQNFIMTYLDDFSERKTIAYLKSNNIFIEKLISNKFLGKLYANNYNNWFDIENAYFKELVLLKNNALEQKDRFNKNFIIGLNNEFKFIKEELKKYLNTIKPKENKKIDEFISSLLGEYNINKRYYFINFNYTDTLSQYIHQQNNTSINYIHGSLANDDIVFGFGNDNNTDYQEIKNIEIDEFLEYFKTFDYLRNSRYTNIHDNINGFYDYEVLFLGHSLGISDKTLLEEILNSNKCSKIHLYKRKDLEGDEKAVEGSFRKLLFAASRIIESDEELRKKVVNYEDSKFFP